MMWRSSSFSGPDGDCVQIRGDLGAVRDSKHSAVVLLVGRAAVDGLVVTARGRSERRREDVA